MLFLMFTLTWITEKELGRQKSSSLEEKRENFIVARTTRAVCENHVKRVWKKEPCEHIGISHAYELFDMRVKFCNTCEKILSCVNFFSMHFITCEIFAHMWNNSVMHINFKFHMHNRCYACEIFHMHMNTFRHVRVSMWIFFLGFVKLMEPLWTIFLWKCHEFLVNTPWKLQN